MDKHTLITVVVTTVVVTTINWLLGSVFGLVSSRMTQDMLKQIFSKNNAPLLMLIFSLLGTVLGIKALVFTGAPITRGDIFAISMSVSAGWTALTVGAIFMGVRSALRDAARPH